MIERLIWLVPIVIAALGAWRPRAGLVAFVAFLPLFGSPPGGPYLGALDVAAIATIITSWRAGRPQPSALSWPAIAFLSVSLLTLIPSPYLPPSWRPSVLIDLLRSLPGVESWSILYTWRAAANLILGLGLFIAVRRAFRDRSPVPVAWGILAGLTGTLVMGLASHFHLIDLGAYRPHHFEQDPDRRMYSLFFLSGWLSQYVVLATPIAAVALMTGRRWVRRAAPLLLALTVCCLLLTQQRGAWLAALGQVAFVAGIEVPKWKASPGRKRRILMLAATSLALVGVLVLGTARMVEPLVEKALSIESGLLPRLSLWKAAVEMLAQRPLLGKGLGAFAPAYDVAHPRGSPDARQHRSTAHSLYLNIAAERGGLGLVAAALLAWCAFVSLKRPRPGMESFSLALATAMVGLAVYGLVQDMFYLKNISWLIWILLGCCALIERPEASAGTERVAHLLLATALIVTLFRALTSGTPTYAGTRSFGFHEPEGALPAAYEWTERRAARLLPWTDRVLVLSLANGHPLAAEKPVAVEIKADLNTVAQLTISGGWQEHRIDVGKPSKDWLLLTVEARPGFRPFSDYRKYTALAPSTDIRLLGVAMKDLQWETLVATVESREPDE